MLTLPAQVQAFQNAGIHSRVPGYLKAWHVDIGAPVKKGQLLAEVDTPDLDQQLAAVCREHCARRWVDGVTLAPWVTIRCGELDWVKRVLGARWRLCPRSFTYR